MSKCLKRVSGQEPETAPKRMRVQDTSEPEQEINILRKMAESYAVPKLILKRNKGRKIPAPIVEIHRRIEEMIAHVIASPSNIDRSVEEMQKWTFEDFLSGLMLYLMDPARKRELSDIIIKPPAPPMTKQEKALLELLTHLQWDDNDTIENVLTQVDYQIMRMTPQNDVDLFLTRPRQAYTQDEIDVIDSISHFYAVLGKHIKTKKLWPLFLLDTLNVLQYGSVLVMRQLFEVYGQDLPLSYRKIANDAHIMCLAYLLHFFEFNDAEVLAIRDILKEKYSLDFQKKDITKILKMLKKAIIELKDDVIERKKIRVVMIVLAKRQGPIWCQKKIIDSIVMPIIAKKRTKETVKHFCISLLGMLYKPYYGEMTVYCEAAIHHLIDMVDDNPSPLIQEAIYTSLVHMRKHNEDCVIKALLQWRPQRVSSYFESQLKLFIQEKPERVWKAILNRDSPAPMTIYKRN